LIAVVRRLVDVLWALLRDDRRFTVSVPASGRPGRTGSGGYAIRAYPPAGDGPSLDRMGHTLLARLHNPGNRPCACLPSCWCRRTKLGYAVRWYTPGRWHDLPAPAGPHHPKQQPVSGA
jgi:hypothetical protein